MQLPGWAVALAALLFGVFFVLAFVLDQIPKLSSKAIKAIRSIRAVRDELRTRSPRQLDE
jgi:hypothetical protein